jgi:hypothetical protein
MDGGHPGCEIRLLLLPSSMAGKSPAHKPHASSSSSAAAAAAVATGSTPLAGIARLVQAWNPDLPMTLSEPEGSMENGSPTRDNVVAKSKPAHKPPRSCSQCKEKDTPQWRTGPDGRLTLCNVCGLLYAKRKARLRKKMVC